MPTTWKDGENKGIVTQSVVAIVVRKGNPKNIQGWDDLVKPGIKVVTPNPGSSGSAKWNILAAYGQVIAGGGSDADAQAYLKKLFGNIAAFPGSAKDATTAFEGGTGDVLLSYENEAIQARAAGADFDYVIPDETLLIENPGAVTKDAGKAAQAFLDYQIGEDGQTDYAKQGFRPLDDSIKVDVKGANDPADAFPDAGDPADDRRGLRRLGRGRLEVLRRRERHRHQADRGLRQVLMASVGIATAPGAARTRRPRSRRSLTAGSGLALGVTMIWFSLLVLIPLTAVLISAAGLGPAEFWRVITQPQTAAALRLTVVESLAVTAVNIVMGTALAWVLVRDRFWGKSLIDIVIDVPFALPTIVAGLVLLSLYGPSSPLGVNVANTRIAVFLALAFVTLPFVVRTVQPVLESLELDVEEAAASLGAGRWTVFRRVILPSLIPAIAAGAALSFARGISEYGSLVLLSGNLPGNTEVASVRVLTFIENGNREAASAVAAIMLLVALLVILVLDLIQRRLARRGD